MRVLWVFLGGLLIPGWWATADIPEHWLERERGFEEGVALQARHRADMILLITSRSPRGPAQRSRQVENDLLRDAQMREFLVDYIKVKLVIPGDSDTEALANERFRVQHGPRLFVIRAGGFTTPIGLFDREQNRRILRSAEEIQQRIREASTPRRSPLP